MRYSPDCVQERISKALDLLWAVEDLSSITALVRPLVGS